MLTLNIDSVIVGAQRIAKNGDFANAQSIYKQILTSDPTDVEALFEFGLLAQELHDCRVDPNGHPSNMLRE